MQKTMVRAVIQARMKFSMTDVDPRFAEAIDWLIRLRHGEVTDWEAFTVWLEADEAHAQAYDVVALANEVFDSPATDALACSAANDDDQAPVRRFGGRVWAVGLATIAAALVAVVAVPMLSPGQNRYEVVTAIGEHRVIELNDGTQIALNGLSRITLDREDSRFARLDEGEAMFSVKRDTARPFAVTVGDNLIQDVGTIFNVIRQSKTLSVEVSEGSVVFNPDREAIPLKAGQTLYDAGLGDTLVIGSKEPSTIGTWREGSLTYQNAQISTLANDLSRNLGVQVSVDPDIATRQFTGVIQVERNPDALFARLSSVLGLDVRKTSKGWTISVRGRATQ